MESLSFGCHIWCWWNQEILKAFWLNCKKKRHKGLDKSFPAGHCLKNPEDKAKAGGRIYILILPNNFIVFGVVETLVLLQFFPEFFFFFLILGKDTPCIRINSDPRSNQCEELHAGTSSLKEAISLQEWWKLRCVFVFITVFFLYPSIFAFKIAPSTGILNLCILPVLSGAVRTVWKVRAQQPSFLMSWSARDSWRVCTWNLTRSPERSSPSV